MGQTITSGDLVKKLGGELIGDTNILINSVASLESANKNSVSFFNNSKYLSLLKNTKAALVILDRESSGHYAGARIVADNPYLYFAKISRLLNPIKILKKEIHKSAIIHSTCKLGRDIYIGPNVIIEENVSVANGVTIHGGVIIESDNVKIGRAHV